MTSFLLPLAAKIIDRALDKLPSDAELGELLLNTALHILKKAVSMTSTKVDDELYAVVEKALNNRDDWLMTEANDLYEDMARLNALYEELMWPHTDKLTMRIEDNHIVIRNLAQEQRDMLESN